MSDPVVDHPQFFGDQRIPTSWHPKSGNTGLLASDAEIQPTLLRFSRHDQFSRGAWHTAARVHTEQIGVGLIALIQPQAWCFAVTVETPQSLFFENRHDIQIEANAKLWRDAGYIFANEILRALPGVGFAPNYECSPKDQERSHSGKPDGLIAEKRVLKNLFWVLMAQQSGGSLSEHLAEVGLWHQAVALSIVWV